MEASNSISIARSMADSQKTVLLAWSWPAFFFSSHLQPNEGLWMAGTPKTTVDSGPRRESRCNRDVSRQLLTTTLRGENGKLHPAPVFTGPRSFWRD